MSFQLFFNQKPSEIPAFLAYNQEQLRELETEVGHAETIFLLAFAGMREAVHPAQFAAFITRHSAIAETYPTMVVERDNTARLVKDIESTMDTDAFKTALKTEIELAQAEKQIAQKEEAIVKEMAMAERLSVEFSQMELRPVGFVPGADVEFTGDPCKEGRQCAFMRPFISTLLMESAVDAGHWWIKYEWKLLCVPLDELVVLP
jgi:hypothetical protein